jgi:hypothetical protein
MKPHWIAFALAAVGAFALLFPAPHEDPAPGWNPPHPLNKRQLSEQPFYQPIGPMTILLRIQPRDQFYKQNGSAINGYTHYAEKGHPLCEITIPDGFIVRGVAELGFASFTDFQLAKTIAHEILHCEAGIWHPTWDEINKDYDQHYHGPITILGSWPPANPADMR